MTAAHIGYPALVLALLCSIGAGEAAAQTSGAPLEFGSGRLAGDEASYLDLGIGTFGTRVGHIDPMQARAASSCATARSFSISVLR